MEAKQDQFKNNYWIIITNKQYEIQIRETKNANQVMLIIPKTEAGKLDYSKKIFLGKLFSGNIKLLGVEFSFNAEKLSLTPEVIKPKTKDEKMENQFGINIWNNNPTVL
jgi:hypothetical protein